MAPLKKSGRGAQRRRATNYLYNQSCPERKFIFAEGEFAEGEQALQYAPPESGQAEP